MNNKIKSELLKVREIVAGNGINVELKSYQKGVISEAGGLLNDRFFNEMKCSLTKSISTIDSHELILTSDFIKNLILLFGSNDKIVRAIDSILNIKKER